MFNYNKNKRFFLKLCECYIDKYEGESLYPSCKRIIMYSIKKFISQSHDKYEFFSDPTVDYELTANNVLCEFSFNELACGRYHIYYGVLNPLNESTNLMSVYKGSMNWAVKNGYITEDEKQKQYRYLEKRISQVG